MFLYCKTARISWNVTTLRIIKPSKIEGVDSFFAHVLSFGISSGHQFWDSMILNTDIERMKFPRNDCFCKKVSLPGFQ